MKKILSTLCLVGAGATALVGQQFTIAQRAPNWSDRAREGSCDVRVWVDNSAEVGLQGERIFVRTLQGQTARNVVTTCTSPLPRSGVTDLRVRATGRGETKLLEQPSNSNGYVAIIRVDDPQNGGSEYGFHVAWRSQGGATYFSDQDYKREWDHSRWDQARQNATPEVHPTPARVDRGWRTDRNERRPIQAQADGWGRIHADGAEGQRISRLTISTERDNDAIVTLDTDRGPVKFTGRIQSQDDRSLGVSLRDAMGRQADGYISIHFDTNHDLQSATMDGNWGSQHFVASFNRRYAR